MNRIATIARHPAVQAALAAYRREIEAILNRIIGIQQIPAPTFAEDARAVYMETCFRELGLTDVTRDEFKNVYGRLPGTHSAGRPALVISAHLDTVFNRETDLSIRRDGDVLYGPGIGDNSTGLAGLVVLAGSLIHHRLIPAADIWFVANAGEEGLGDLCGMRAVVDRFGSTPIYLVIEGGLYGQLTHQAVGVRRYRIDISAPGGHSWGGFGAASAIHVLGHLIVAIDNLNVPHTPKTTYNIGLIDGGLSINTIASSAQLWLDLRSEADRELKRLIASLQSIVTAMNHDHAEKGTGVSLTIEPVGNRPAGSIDRHSPIVTWAEAALLEMGCEHVRYIVSSTDANLPLSRGYQAVCLGLTQSGNSHRMDEYIDIKYLPAGLGQLLLVVLAAANDKESWNGL
jgi:tripeptide aminopeptidase